MLGMLVIAAYSTDAMTRGGREINDPRNVPGFILRVQPRLLLRAETSVVHPLKVFIPLGRAVTDELPMAIDTVSRCLPSPRVVDLV